MFDKIIEKEKDNIIKTTCELIKFKSISLENKDSSNPFGIDCSKALEYTLNLGKEMGFKTKNLDNYCGYIEFGEGKDLVGIIGHLDVVPALEEDGWDSSPFFPIIKDGKIFGRGAIDDKGPVIASLYAMKAVSENIKVSKRVRFILGLNKEKSWKCIKHYKSIEEWPQTGFSPDANFPAIYAEKGIMSISLENYFKIKNFEIIEIDCKNNALNVVPKYCAITLKANTNNNIFINNIINNESNNEIKLTKLDNSTLKIESFGISAHSAHPELGKNAITILIKFLVNNFEFENNYLNTLFELGLFDIYSPKFLSENKKIEDESGILTSNIAFLEYKNNKLVIKINLRVPVTFELEKIEEKYNNLKNRFPNLIITTLSKQNPLYIDKNSNLVKKLVNIFNKKTGLNEEPIAIGGGTYARAFKNFISYGMTMPGDKDMCHQVNEFIEIDKLILSAKIYAEAIYELSK